MKPVPTKAQLRHELQQQIDQYLQTGGAIQDIPRGQSSYVQMPPSFGQVGEQAPRPERTPLDDVVKALEARKHPQHSLKRPKKPRKKLLTDDFGEPLRWIWVED